MDRRPLRYKNNKIATPKIDGDLPDLSGMQDERHDGQWEHERATQTLADAVSRFAATVANQTGWRPDDPRFSSAWQAVLETLDHYKATAW